ncbi:kinase-like domain-containing protein [Phaeosphaeria sp. MPI-PUGE-AT-0046c]|nr:kinase-like domain-containing protein [Phaeosphaeria sp. MPI-PUGE-AT-0046c]
MPEADVVADGSDGSEIYEKSLGKLDEVRRELKLLEAGEKGIVRRYRDEANLLGQCRHEHIIGLKGFADREEAEEVQLELELAPYGNVGRFGTSGASTKSSLAHRMEQIVQVVDGVAYLHKEMKMAHGSLDLSHLLVFAREGDKQWPSGLVKLGGLGSATRIGTIGQPRTALDYQPPESFTDVSGTAAGYRSYAQLRMEGSYDVYSIGRLLLQWVLKIRPDREVTGVRGQDYESRVGE